MYWNRTAAGDVREEMPLSSISRGAGGPAATAESANPGTSAQITSTCCTPPPSYHNINLPLGHPSTLTNERGAPPSYEEAIDPNGMSSPIRQISLVSRSHGRNGRIHVFLSFCTVSSTAAVLRFSVRSDEGSP